MIPYNSSILSIGIHFVAFLLATRLCRQAQARDDKAGAWTSQGAKHSPPFTSSLPHLTSLHGLRQPTLQPAPTPLPTSTPSALKTATGNLTAMLGENATAKDAYPISTTLNPTNTTPVAWPSAAGRPTLTGGMSTGRVAGASSSFLSLLVRKLNQEQQQQPFVPLMCWCDDM